VVTAEGAGASEPYSEEDLAKFTSIVKEAIGFNELRGDSVMVTNIAFKKPEVPEALPEIPLWEQAWALDIAKQAVGGIFALILIFVVLKPTIKSLLEKPVVTLAQEGMMIGADGMPMAIPAGGGQAAGDGQLALESDEELMMLDAPKSYEQRLEMAQKIAAEDPKRVAQVMKTWIQE
jgi:flagellar M-ring protein FliF